MRRKAMINLNSLFAVIGHTLWAISLQVAVLIVFIGILALFFRKASSSFRYFLWCIVLVRLCIPFKLEMPFMSWSRLQTLISAHLPSVTREVDLPSLFYTSPEIPPVSGGTATIEPIPGILPVNEPETIPIILAVLWLSLVLGASILIIRFIMRTHRLLEQCPSIERVELIDLLKSLCKKMGIKRIVPLRYLNITGHNEPSVVGIFRPVIYLPRSIADTWNVRDIEPILLHELSHIRQHDLFINMVQAITQIFYFFHPLVWFANWRIRVLREEVCDDLSIRMLDSQRSHYIRSILNFIEEPRTKSPWVFSGIGFSEGYGTIQKRVRRIMKIHYKPGRKLGALSAAFLVAVGTAGLVLSSEQTGIEKPLTGDKTYAALEKTGVFEKIATKPEEPMDDEKKKLIAKYLANPEDNNKISFRIAQGWGKQLRPPDALKKAPINLAAAVNRYSRNLDAKIDTHVSLDSPKIFEAPFVYITSDKQFNLTKDEAANFGNYLRNGGFAFIDNCASSDKLERVEAALKQMLRDTLGSDVKFSPIPDSHQLFHCFFDFNNGAPGGYEDHITKSEGDWLVSRKMKLEGVWIGNRLAVVYSNNGYCHSWNKAKNNDAQLKFGVNLVVYAVQQENGIGYRNFMKPKR